MGRDLFFVEVNRWAEPPGILIFEFSLPLHCFLLAKRHKISRRYSGADDCAPSLNEARDDVLLRTKANLPLCIH
jgi:hypothetical protein